MKRLCVTVTVYFYILCSIYGYGLAGVEYFLPRFNFSSDYHALRRSVPAGMRTAHLNITWNDGGVSETVFRSVAGGEVSPVSVPRHQLSSTNQMNDTELGVHVTSDSPLALFTSYPCSQPPCQQILHSLDVLGLQYSVIFPVHPTITKYMIHITAVYNKTEVSITLADIPGLRIGIDNRTYNAGDTMALTMNALETVVLESDNDFSSSMISSASRVCVMQEIVCNAEGEFSVITPIPHAQSWGTTYILLLDSNDSGLLRIIGNQMFKSLVRVSNGYTSTIHNMDPRALIEVNITESMCIWVESDRPILVLYTRVTNEDQALLSMLPIPSVHYIQPFYAFEVLKTPTYVSIVIAQGQNGHILLNGQTLHRYFRRPIQWLSIQTRDGTFLATSIQLKLGVHTLGHENTDVGFVAHTSSIPLAIPRTLVPISTRTVPPDNLPINENMNNRQTSAVPQSTTPATAQPATVSVETTLFEKLSKATTSSSKQDNIETLPTPSINDGFMVLTESSRSKANVVNFHQAGAAAIADLQNTSGLSATVIAVIVSLTSAIFFVIICISGFVVTEVVCKGELFNRNKVSPFVN